MMDVAMQSAQWELKPDFVAFNQYTTNGPYSIGWLVSWCYLWTLLRDGDAEKLYKMET